MYSARDIFIGLFWALGFGHFGTSIIVNKFWKHIQGEGNIERPYAYTAVIVGSVERTLYFFAILLGFGEFVAVWLALKVAGKWARWEKDEKKDGKYGRVFYNIFLVGSGISLGFAFSGVNLVYLLDEESSIWWLAPIAIIVGLVILYGLICLLQYVYDKKTKPKEKDE